MLFNYVHLYACFVVRHLNLHRSRSPNGTLQSPACTTSPSHANLGETFPPVPAEILPIIVLQKERNTRFVSNFLIMCFRIYILLTFTVYLDRADQKLRLMRIPRAKYSWHSLETQVNKAGNSLKPPRLLFSCSHTFGKCSVQGGCNILQVPWYVYPLQPGSLWSTGALICVIKSFEFGRIDFIKSYLQPQRRQ